MGQPRFFVAPLSHHLDEKTKQTTVQSDNSSSTDEELLLGSMEELNISPIQVSRNLLDESDDIDSIDGSEKCSSADENDASGIEFDDESAYTCLNEAHSVLEIDNQLLLKECDQLG